MKERKNAEIEPAIPQVEYKYDEDNNIHPFRVRLNAAELASRLSEDFGLKYDQIRRSRFIVNDQNIMAGISFTFSARGGKVEQTHELGSTSAKRNNDGFRDISINIGSIMFSHDQDRNLVLDYCVLSKLEQ